LNENLDALQTENENGDITLLGYMYAFFGFRRAEEKNKKKNSRETRRF
jgi:hypothetical protein